jgi:glycosyltransferase involved in cell wall biosynthesis
VSASTDGLFRHSAPRRLLVIGPTPPPYHGVAVATQALLSAPWREGFSLLHLDLADRRGIQHVDKPDLHDVGLFIRQWVRLIVMLARYRPRLSYVPLSQSTVGFLRDSFLIWPAHWSGSEVVLHLHGGNFRAWYESRSPAMRVYVRAVLSRAARVIVLGESLKALFRGLVPDERLAVVPNGVPWRGQTKEQSSNDSPGRFRVLYLGTLSRNKGVLCLLEAIAEVQRRQPHVEFVLAGSWASARDEQDARTIIARHALGAAIVFAGSVHGCAKEQLFASADLFVFPGVQQEGQPLVVIEAMAAGLPVLYTARGCLSDTVLEGQQGMEVRIADPHDLAQKILWMAGHPEEARRMGCSARQRYESCYTSDHFSSSMRSVFGHVVGELG